MPTEAPIHFELYRGLKNEIEMGATYHGITYSEILPDFRVDGGRADLVIFDERKKPRLVIEAKRESPRGFDRDLDPYSPKVVDQAFGYAARVGADYFATYNGKVLVLFRTFESGKPLLQRKSKAYRVRDPSVFAGELLRELARLEAGVGKWDPRDSAFVGRLKHFHERIRDRFQRAFDDKLQTDSTFKTKFEYWLREQGKDLQSANKKEASVWKRSFAEQGAYLLMNKILFYKTLESERLYPMKKLPGGRKGFSAKLRSQFRQFMDDFDFEAVFEQDPVFDEIPLDSIEEDLQEFIAEIGEYDLTQFDSDVVGRIYEGIIPPKERHDMGEYYTPPEICELIVKLAIQGPDDQVLDPGCGSGGFAVAAYHRLKELKLVHGKKSDHNAILSQINAIDINRFPAHLTAINLAIRDLSERTSKVKVEIADFFDVTAGQGRFMKRSATVTGEKEEAELDIPNLVDAIVANPPYVRQEDIKDKKKVRAHLKSLGLEQVINRRSDIYCYFFTNAHGFLSDRGRLGFITSDRWLDVGYGEGLQKFFLGNHKILCIIIFDKKAFEVPLIGSVIVVLEKCGDKKERASNVVKFLRLKGNQTVQEVLDLLASENEPELLIETGEYRLVTRLQQNLEGETKWNRFLQAPPLYFELLENEKIVALEQVADVRFGLKTGANDFFYFRGSREVEAHGLEDFTSPLVKAIGQTDFVEFRRPDTDWYVLDLHSVVEGYSKKRSGGGQRADLAGFIKEKFREDGLKNLVDYIELGEKKGVNRRPTCRSRNPWFDLGKLESAPLLGSMFYWKRYAVLLNVASLPADAYLTYIQPKPDISEKFLCAVLNSGVAQLFMEMHGRIAKGEALDRVQMKVYETKQLRLPSPHLVSEEDHDAILEAFDHLLQVERSEDETLVQEAKEELDRAVMRSLDMEERTEELEEVLEELLQRRIAGGAQRTEVMLTRPGGVRIRLRGGRAVEATTLEDFR